MDIVARVVISAAVHVLGSLPPGVVVLGCAVPLGLSALHRSKKGVQGEVKAHPATGSTDALTSGSYWLCFFFLLVSLVFRASAFGTDFFPLGFAVLPDEVVPSFLPGRSSSSSESESSSISISAPCGAGGVTDTAIPCSVRICMKACAIVVGEASCQTLGILPCSSARLRV